MAVEIHKQEEVVNVRKTPVSLALEQSNGRRKISASKRPCY
jgi:hypothetical protein